jgi:hypothetical protein
MKEFRGLMLVLAVITAVAWAQKPAGDFHPAIPKIKSKAVWFHRAKKRGMGGPRIGSSSSVLPALPARAYTWRWWLEPAAGSDYRLMHQDAVRLSRLAIIGRKCQLCGTAHLT